MAYTRGVPPRKSFSSLNCQKEQLKGKRGLDKVKFVAENFTKRCKEKGFNDAVFDKGAYSYSGRVKIAYESCKDNGLKI